MRTILVKVVWIVAFMIALAAAISWGHFIWSFDWGHSYRGRALWMWALFLPASLGFFAILFVVCWALSLVWEAIFRAKFPW